MDSSFEALLAAAEDHFHAAIEERDVIAQTYWREELRYLVEHEEEEEEGE